MTTGTIVIEAALRSIGKLSSGASPSTTEIADALSALNMLIGSWSYEELFIPYKVSESKSISITTASIDIGSGAAWDTVRPLRIENLYVRDAANIDHRVELIDSDTFANLATKRLAVGRPRKAYYEPVSSAGITAGTLHFDRTTNVAETFHMISQKEMSELASAGATISLPTPWIRALKFNLSLELAGEKGVEVTQTQISLANDAKAYIAKLTKEHRRTTQEIIQDAMTAQANQ